jgi:D-aminoacyl-tRNA deacylase
VRALVQRVGSAAVSVEGDEVAAIGRGLLVLLGVRRGDTAEQADWIVRKVASLRVFEGDGGRMDRSVTDIGGDVLCVSQFTLYGDARRGSRPSFTEAAPPEEAEPLYERVRSGLGAQGGRFGARMAVELVNDGPVTLLLESPLTARGRRPSTRLY